MADEKAIDTAAVEALAVIHGLEAAICALSRHPKATDRLLALLCEAYGDIAQLERDSVPRND